MVVQNILQVQYSAVLRLSNEYYRCSGTFFRPGGLLVSHGTLAGGEAVGSVDVRFVETMLSSEIFCVGRWLRPKK
jgi:hypothetical protein